MLTKSLIAELKNVSYPIRAYKHAVILVIVSF